MVELNDKEKEFLQNIQSGFPITENPYKTIGEKLGMAEEEAVKMARHLVEKGLVRKIGPFFDSKKMGFKSTLVAAKVKPEKTEETAAKINNFNEVTHNYGREHEYNLWFTLIAPTEEKIQTILDEIREIDGVEKVFSLPAEKLFKIKVNLNITGQKETKTNENTESSVERDEYHFVVFQEEEKELINAMQKGIPVEERPFHAIAKVIDQEEWWVIQRTKKWLENGIIRRFGAAVKHTKAGYKANAMVVWKVSPEQEDEAGRLFARNPNVSHCYIRPSFEGFKYTLYTMVHAKSEEELDKTICELASSSGLTDYMPVKSLKEYKKSSPVYF